MSGKLIPNPEKISKDEKVHLPVIKEKETTAIRLSGVAVNTKGELTKHQYFEFLDIDFDDYSDIEFTPEEGKKVAAHLRKMRTGHTAMVPMICSPKCPFRLRCSLFQMEKAPFGRSCFWEVQLIREWTEAYFNDYQVDPNNFTEVGIINELAEIEVYLWRLSQTLSKTENAELIEENVVGFAPDGQPLTTKQLSSALAAKESLYSRRAKLIKLMVGDRQEKYKREAALKVREEGDASSSMAELKTRLDKLSRDMNKKQIAMKEASGEIIEVKAEDKPKELTADDLISGDDE
jgi:hypothetical protein